MTLNKQILEYMEGKGLMFSGHIASEVSKISQSKVEIIGRRLRELFRAGKIERVMVDNPKGKGSKVVAYRKVEECKHNEIQIDVLRSRCDKCGKYLETNPYTGQVTEISKESVDEIIRNKSE